MEWSGTRPLGQVGFANRLHREKSLAVQSNGRSDGKSRNRALVISSGFAASAVFVRQQQERRPDALAA